MKHLFKSMLFAIVVCASIAFLCTIQTKAADRPDYQQISAVSKKAVYSSQNRRKEFHSMEKLLEYLRGQIINHKQKITAVYTGYKDAGYSRTEAEKRFKKDFKRTGISKDGKSKEYRPVFQKVMNIDKKYNPEKGKDEKELRKLNDGEIAYNSYQHYRYNVDLNEDNTVYIYLNPDYFQTMQSSMACNKMIYDIVYGTGKNQLNLGNVSGNYAKVKKIHDWICSNAEYYDEYKEADKNKEAENRLYRTEAGVLLGHKNIKTGKKEKSFVCQGYAVLFDKMCECAGVPCHMIDGDVKRGGKWRGHTWNIVKLEGKWYYLDCTYDDNGTKKQISYEYFLTDPKEFLSVRRVWEPFLGGKNYVTQNYKKVFKISRERYRRTLTVTSHFGEHWQSTRTIRVKEGMPLADKFDQVTMPFVISRNFRVIGWYTKKSGGREVTAETSFKRNADIYQRTSAVLKFDGSYVDGTYTYTFKTEREVIYGEKVGELPVPEEREGYAFSGWYDKPGGYGKQLTEDETGIYYDQTYYASWTEILEPDEFYEPYADE